MSNSKKKQSAAKSSESQHDSSENETGSNSSEQTPTPENEGQEKTEAGSTSSDGPSEAADAPETPENADQAPEDQDGENGREKGIQAPQETAYVGSVPEGRIIGIGEEVVIDATEQENFAVVNVDHYQERHLRGSKRIAHTLLYVKGQHIPLTLLKKA